MFRFEILVTGTVIFMAYQFGIADTKWASIASPILLGQTIQPMLLLLIYYRPEKLSL